MKLETIVTLANKSTELLFRAMERSLRATGCSLPILVIPYDNQLFELPPNSSWWRVEEVLTWLDGERAHPTMRKYQCFTIANYQFVDTDVCFLRDPQAVLQPHLGFITSCTHWNNTDHTLTKESYEFIRARTTTWQRLVFNAGQFACDRPLYSVDALKRIASDPSCRDTCLDFPHHDQPGTNLLVWNSGVEITNLTLPPYLMESTWAGYYPAGLPQSYRSAARKPYLIHWAGLKPDGTNRIDDLFFTFLDDAERSEWTLLVAKRTTELASELKFGNRLLNALRRVVKTR